MNRKRLILAVLLVVLALAAGYSILVSPHQQKAEKGIVTPGSRTPGAKRNPAAGEERRVRLDLLQNTKVGFTGFKKNIFAPIFRDQSKLPPVKPVIAAPPPPPPPPVVTLPTVSPLERDLAQFIFLGLLEKERKKTIFLSKNKEIFLVKKGDRIAGKYEAAAITDDALTIRVLGGDTLEIIVPLIDNQALKPSSHQESVASPPPSAATPQQTATPQQGATPQQPARSRRSERTPLSRLPGAGSGAMERSPAGE